MSCDETLRVEGLKKYFPLRKKMTWRLFSRVPGYIRAVDDVTFSLKSGEILGFVGESGCGKSTLGRTILRLVEPTAGRIFYESKEVTSLAGNELKNCRRHMQMIFQDPFSSLNPRRTVAGTLRQTIRIHRLCRSREEESCLIRATLKEVGLEPAEEFWNKYPAHLSGGQLQRVSIGRAVILRPSLVIADEPVSMLDVSVRIGILDLISRLRDVSGISWLYITHDLATARYLCDRVAIMYLGRILEIGLAEAVFARPLHPYTHALICSAPVPDPTVKPIEVPIRNSIPCCSDEFGEGCAFNSRCPRKIERCLKQAPRLTRSDHKHPVACLNPMS
jgi:peptide/nickel transport system ATP-binding protein